MSADLVAAPVGELAQSVEEPVTAGLVVPSIPEFTGGGVAEEAPLTQTEHNGTNYFAAKQAGSVVPSTPEFASEDVVVEAQLTQDEHSCANDFTAEQDHSSVAVGTEPLPQKIQSHTAAPRRPAADMLESRLEALLEQQNLLLSRQLVVAEETHERAEASMQFQQPASILNALDPGLRKVFKLWRADLQAQLRCYVALTKQARQYEDTIAHGEMIKPFRHEAQQTWSWPAFYRQAASAIPGVELCAVDQSCANHYDIDFAFQSMKARHAHETQAFVVAHHMKCLNVLTTELTLEKQTKQLLSKVANWAVNATYCRPSFRQHVEQQAKVFADLTYRHEMAQAEGRLTAGHDWQAATSLTLVIRCVCALILILAVFMVDHDMLERVFSVFVAVLCGASLIWEDVVVRCMKTVFGDKSLQLRSPTHMLADMWRTY